jgi:hypothetical protein
MNIISKLKNAFKTMDLFIYPPPNLLKRLMILMDKKIMEILYNYNSDDYYLCGFYRLKLSARKTFLGENNGYKKIASLLNDPKDIIKFKNKELFNKIFYEYLHRDWLSINNCTYNELVAFCKKHTEFIKKPISQYGGSGIEKQTISKNTNLFNLYNKLKDENCLIEEIIIQDRDIASFNPNSVNTFRIYSILNQSNVIIIDAYLRMGVGNVIVDNQCMGGIAAKIDIETGIITTQGRDVWARSFILHPYTNKQIIGFKISKWIKIKKLIEKAAKLVPTVRYVAWDVAINDNGDICLIEGNDKGSFLLQESTDLQGKKDTYEKLLLTLT